MRKRLQEERKKKRLTQQQVADYLGIGLRHYRFIESGDRKGDFEVWDMLEDLFNIHQRLLRELSSD